MRLSVIWPNPEAVSETFIARQVKHLPAQYVITGPPAPLVNGRIPRSQSFIARAFRKMSRLCNGRGWDAEVIDRYVAILRDTRTDVVLAQYGPTGVAVQEACRITGVPLVVHFHGYDVGSRRVLNRNAYYYRKLFNNADGFVAVSRSMESRLVEIGAPRAKVHYIPYGVDTTEFVAGSPSNNPPVFLAVGRFVEKKAPFITLVAFAQLVKLHTDARLRMIGEGPLLDSCRDLATGLGIGHAVTFLGVQTNDVVLRELGGARAFVQHSVQARSGDCEGTPVAIIEAGASGLPVVATRHEGIPDVVIDGETGFLVEERDAAAMAMRMIALVEEPSLAARLGRAARARVEAHFNLDRSMTRLRSLLEACSSRALSPISDPAASERMTGTLGTSAHC